MPNFSVELRLLYICYVVNLVNYFVDFTLFDSCYHVVSVMKKCLTHQALVDASDSRSINYMLYYIVRALIFCNLSTVLPLITFSDCVSICILFSV